MAEAVAAGRGVGRVIGRHIANERGGGGRAVVDDLAEAIAAARGRVEAEERPQARVVRRGRRVLREDVVRAERLDAVGGGAVRRD